MMGIIIGVAIVLVIIGVILSGYIKARPDEAILISGYKSKPRVVTGKSAIMVPFLERKDGLTLRIIKIDVKTARPVPTNEFIDVSVDSVVTAKISSDPKLIEKAAQNFLNRSEEYIMDMVTDVLEGNIREIIGTMTLKEMISDRQEFARRVEENAVPDMAKMGVEIVSFNVQNFWDTNGIIEALGVENTSKIKMTAQITKADAEKEVAIAQARANKASNDEEVKSKQEIAEKQHELDIKTAQLKQSADTQRAEADAAYRIQEESQRKTIEIAKADADLARQEKEIELQEKQVRIKEQTLDAEIKKTAEAESYARERKADADLYESKQMAQAEVEKAKAKRTSQEQEAIGLQAIAEAEAAGIKAKGLAEAEGIDKLAEAQRKMGEASILEMYFEKLPLIAEQIAKPLSNIDSITMYGEGNTAKMVEDITKSTNQIFSGLTEGAGIDVKSMIAGFLGGKVATPKLKTNDLNGIDVESAIEAVKSAGAKIDSETSSKTETNTIKSKRSKKSNGKNEFELPAIQDLMNDLDKE